MRILPIQRVFNLHQTKAIPPADWIGGRDCFIIRVSRRAKSRLTSLRG